MTATQFTGRVVLVTGASRGVGAEVARQLAAGDTHVVLNYREKRKRADAVVQDIVAAGGSASTLRAGEDAIRAMAPVLELRGLALTVVSGDMVDGTIIVRLLEWRDPDAVAARRMHGDLPTVHEFARAIAGAVNGEADGETVYVGGRDYLSRA